MKIYTGHSHSFQFNMLFDNTRAVYETLEDDEMFWFYFIQNTKSDQI